MKTALEVPAEPGSQLDQQFLVKNDRLRSAQRRFALVTIIGPFFGTVCAIVLWSKQPPSAIDLVLLAILYVLTSLGITVGFHRHFSHRAFQALPGLRVALGVLGSMAAQGTIIYWAATHRRHHQFPEQALDPHSPYVRENGEPLGRLRGFWHSHIGWMLEGHLTNTVKFTPDLIRDPLISRISGLFPIWVILGLGFPAVVSGLLTTSWMGALSGLLWGGFVRMFLVHHVMWTGGSTAHMFGTSPFETPDRSTNNFLLALPNLGEAWHNNHHAFPRSAQLGLQWWEIDIGGWAIRAFEKLGWVWDVHRPSKEIVAAKRMESTMHHDS